MYVRHAGPRTRVGALTVTVRVGVALALFILVLLRPAGLAGGGGQRLEVLSQPEPGIARAGEREAGTAEAEAAAADTSPAALSLSNEGVALDGGGGGGGGGGGSEAGPGSGGLGAGAAAEDAAAGGQVPAPTDPAGLTDEPADPRSGPCLPDDEGAWSIGLFRGPSPLDLAPAGVPQNPIITCASVSNPPSNFVADPFLWRTRYDLWHIFFETKNNVEMQGDIGVVESTDGGASWRYLGLALDEPWHLSYPFVFQWQDKLYMLPESYQTGTVRLYRAVRFPVQWDLEAVLLERPLVDVSLVQWEGRWWMFGVDEGAQQDLEIHYADSPQGPWQPHALSPLSHSAEGGPAAARLAGRVVAWQGCLLRFAQDCRRMYGHKVVAYQVDTLTPTEYRESEVPFGFGGPPEAGAWNGGRHHHIDAQQLPDGSWVAVMDGDREVRPRRR